MPPGTTIKLIVQLTIVTRKQIETNIVFALFDLSTSFKQKNQFISMQLHSNTDSKHKLCVYIYMYLFKGIFKIITLVNICSAFKFASVKIPIMNDISN